MCKDVIAIRLYNLLTPENKALADAKIAALLAEQKESSSEHKTGR